DNGKATATKTTAAKPAGAKEARRWQSPQAQAAQQEKDRNDDPVGWLNDQTVFRKVPDLKAVRQIGEEDGEDDLGFGDDSSVKLGGVAEVLTPRRVQESIAGQMHVVIPEYTRKNWAPIAEAILAASVLESVGEGPDLVLAEWVVDYHFQSDQPVKDMAD